MSARITTLRARRTSAVLATASRDAPLRIPFIDIVEEGRLGATFRPFRGKPR